VLVSLSVSIGHNRKSIHNNYSTGGDNVNIEVDSEGSVNEECTSPGRISYGSGRSELDVGEQIH